MKHSVISLYVGAMLVIAFLLVPSVAPAAEFRTGSQTSLASSETLNEDVYMTGGNVTSAGIVQGDLIATGGSVLVRGPVFGDLLAGGGNVTILGEVGDDLRAGGGNVVVSGAVDGDAIIGGGQVNLAGGKISGDAVIGAGVLRIESAITGDARIGGGEIYINAPIGGNVQIQADKVTLGPNARIQGNLSYKAKKEAIFEEGAVVRGDVNFTELAQRSVPTKLVPGILAGIFSLWLIGKFLVALAGALLIGLIFKKYSRELVRIATAEPLLEFGRGVIFAIVVPVFSIVLLVTIIGIPLGIMGFLVYGATMIFISLAAPIVIGSVTHKWFKKAAGYEVNWKIILLGVCVYSLLGIIPLVGWIARCIATTITLGAALKIKWGLIKDWQ